MKPDLKHPYGLRTWIRMHLPWWIINLGIAAKGPDCDAQTLERVYIPPDLVGFVEGRSSWVRIGVTIHVTAPKIDPGFNATITLQMVTFQGQTDPIPHRRQ